MAQAMDSVSVIIPESFSLIKEREPLDTERLHTRLLAVLKFIVSFIIVNYSPSLFRSGIKFYALKRLRTEK